jgi:AcrR family transcriptional regulator
MAKRRSDERGGEGARPAGEARAAATERAILELSGERGYGEVTVATLLERSGADRTWFYRTYDGKPDCYARAYEAAAEELYARLLGACRGAAGPAGGIGAALEYLCSYLAADRALATGVIAEVRVAGGDALAKRNEVFERLSRAIGPARRETPGSRHSPPPDTASFILWAIEAAVIRALRDGGSGPELSGELTALAQAYDLGQAGADGDRGGRPG